MKNLSEVGFFFFSQNTSKKVNQPLLSSGTHPPADPDGQHHRAADAQTQRRGREEVLRQDLRRQRRRRLKDEKGHSEQRFFLDFFGLVWSKKSCEDQNHQSFSLTVCKLSAETVVKV